MPCPARGCPISCPRGRRPSTPQRPCPGSLSPYWLRSVFLTVSSPQAVPGLRAWRPVVIIGRRGRPVPGISAGRGSGPEPPLEPGERGVPLGVRDLVAHALGDHDLEPVG